MIDLRERLSGRAFQVLPGSGYNRFRLEAGATPTLWYEVALPVDAAWPFVAERVMPPFARYLASRKQDPEDPRGVVVAAFLGESCYLVRGEEWIEMFREIEGLGRDALHFRVLRWLAESG